MLYCLDFCTYGKKGHSVNTIWTVLFIHHGASALVKCRVATTPSSPTWHISDFRMIMGLIWSTRGNQDCLTTLLIGFPQEAIAFFIRGSRKCRNQDNASNICVDDEKKALWNSEEIKRSPAQQLRRKRKVD